MTVDDRSFSAFSKINAEKARNYIKQVRDVTGIADDEQIKRALDKARQPEGGFNLHRAVDLLMSANGDVGERRLITVREEEMPASPPALPLHPAAAAAASQSPRPVVDLTEESTGGNKADDLQRAIELSLAEGGGPAGNAFSQEEQDVSKALEASLLESSRSRRKTDSQNPHDKKRDGEWPVGLKNVGQTCWFSAVIQSLFHLPAFRHLVLNFQPVQQHAKTENQRVIEFMLELRKLFALLVGSQRSYVDPSRAVGILRGSEGQFTSNSQQDVSEFTHNLLDWLEEAFNTNDGAEPTPSGLYKVDPNAMDSESEKCDKEKEAFEEKENVARDTGTIGNFDKPVGSVAAINPMKNLFYGLVKIEGRNQGNVFTKEEPFGQWPLQVNNFSDIHEALNASTAHESIDTSSQSDLACSSNGQQPLRKSGQERWFTKLPPVLFFELCRFKFNQQKCVAEKVNNFLDFPETIYLDRYLEVNKNITRSKREEVKSLQERQESLRSQLKGYQEYGSEPRLPLVSVLKHALEFTRSGSIAAESDSPNNCAMQVDSPCPSPASLTPSSSVTNLSSLGRPAADNKPPPQALKTLPDGSVIIPIRVEGPSLEQTPMEVELSQPEGPAPRQLSELELKVISAALARWHKEVEEDIAALNKALQDIEYEISTMYEDPSLKQTPYRLHAVMVHEGDANQGHYWAYVFHSARQAWLKFNDNTVSETTWEAMKKESTGGRMNTSAYSMVYIDANRSDLRSEARDPGATRKALPEDLETFLMDDNKLFAVEMMNWDREQERKAKAAAEECQDGVLIGDDPECQIIEHNTDLASSHSLLAQDVTRRGLAGAMGRILADSHKPGGSGSGANCLAAELRQMAETRLGAADIGEEPRLQSFVHFLANMKVREEVLRRALLEQVAYSGLQTVSEANRWVVQEARDLLSTEASPGLLEEVKKWHRAYHNFRVACYYYLLGVDRFQEHKLEESVELLTTAYALNQRLLEDPPVASNAKLKAIPDSVLMKQLHSSVEALNLRYVEEFESGENTAEISQVSQSVSKVLVPAIHILQARTNTLGSLPDSRLLEEVRSRWCTMLETQMPKAKHDYWTTIFNTVVSDESPVTQRQPQNLRYPKLSEDRSLASRYYQAALFLPK